VQSVFKAAAADRLIGWSPCTGVTLPAAEAVERLMLTPEQVDAVVAATPARYRALMVVLSVCGPRIGEALAMCADDVDRDAGVLRIRRQLGQKAQAFAPLKVRASRRDIPVPRHVLTALAEHQLAYPPLRGDADFDGLMFTSPQGRPLHYDTFARIMRRTAAQAGVPWLTALGLRHHAGSTLLHRGVPVTTVAKVLGNTPAVLLRTYAHALPSGDDLARQAMERSPNVSLGVSQRPVERGV